jgi:hypothetical protein
LQYGDKATMVRTKAYMDQFMRVWLGLELKKSKRRWVSYTKKGMAFQNPLGVEGADTTTYPMQVRFTAVHMSACCKIMTLSKFRFHSGKIVFDSYVVNPLCLVALPRTAVPPQSCFKLLHTLRLV